MSATITNSLKKQLVQGILDDSLDSDTNYFIGIGRSEVWNDSDATPANAGAGTDVLDFRLSLQSVKLADSVSYVIPRHNWTNGTVYDAYNDSVQGYTTNGYYVLTAANAVYICLEQGKDANGVPVSSTIEPVGASETSFRSADGYVWKFLYTLNAGDATSFLSANYMPVKLQAATDSDSPATDIEQEEIQNAAVAGQITSIRVVSQGAGYSSTPTVTIVGDGTGASATATLSGTNVVKITLDEDSAGEILHGSGYTYANVVLSGGSPTTEAVCRVVISENGIGADPRDDLKSSGIMFNAKPDGTEDGNFIVGNDFRQVGLLKNVSHDDSDGLFDATSGMALSYLDFDTVASSFTVDREVEGTTSGARAIVDYYDSTNRFLYFHQNVETGFKTFVDGETVTEVSGSGTGTLEASGAVVPGDINPFSGEVLYIENRTAIDRASDQTEDIKLVIQF